MRVEEELRDDEVGARVHFAAQVRQVLRIARAVWVSLGVSRDANCKVVFELVSNEAHEIHCVAKAVARRLPVLLAARNVYKYMFTMLIVTPWQF